MSVSLLRRFALLTVLVVVCFHCASFDKRHDRFCTTGNYSKSHPMICVDERTLTATPNPAHVFDVEAKGGTPSNRPVVVHWFTQRTADLQISFRDTSCTERVECDGKGHCVAVIKKLDTKTSRRCTYGMFLGDSKLDPDADIVVDPCCW